MDSVYLDPVLSDSERREHLLPRTALRLFATPGSKALVEFARDMIKRAFGGLDPETAQFQIPVAEIRGAARRA